MTAEGSNGEPDDDDTAHWAAWGGEDDSSPEYAGLALLDLLVDMKNRGKLTAVATCQIAYYARCCGGRGAFEALSVKPGKQAGKYSRHFDKVVNGGLPRDDDYYMLDLPLYDRRVDVRVVEQMPILMPHEVLQEHLEGDSGREVLVRLDAACAADQLPHTYSTSPVVMDAPPGVPVLPVCLYLDSVGFAREDKALGFWLSCAITGRRWLLFAIRASSVCTCGCKGWCTYYHVFLALHHSFACLATGRLPTQRYDGTPFSSGRDAARRYVAGRTLPFRSALLALRGDWLEYASTVGFPGPTHSDNPCPFCTATAVNMHDYAGLSASSYPDKWAPKTWESYCDACAASETVLNLSDKQWRTLRAALVFDASKGGRVLTQPLPQLGLLKGDRLEPCPTVLDIGKGFDHANPGRAVMWRFRQTGATRHRNPLFDDALGITPSRVMGVDWLHAFSLGILRPMSGALIWTLVASDAWGAWRAGQTTIDGRLRYSIKKMTAELFQWYREEGQQGRVWPRVQNLTPGMVGTANSATLKIQGSEHNAFLHFEVALIAKYWDVLGADKARLWRDLVRSLLEVKQFIKDYPLRMPALQAHSFGNAFVKALKLLRSLDVHALPKEHLCVHLARDAALKSAPGMFGCWEDEYLNKTLKQIAAASHRSIWAWRVLRTAEDLLRKYQSKRRRLLD